MAFITFPISTGRSVQHVDMVELNSGIACALQLLTDFKWATEGAMDYQAAGAALRFSKNASIAATSSVWAALAGGSKVMADFTTVSSVFWW